MVILDDGDRIEWCNPKAEAYFGLDSQRDRGQQITYLVRQPQFVEYLSSNHVGEPLVLRFRARAGELMLSVQLVPYGDSDKLLLGRDITRWERLETTRRDFVANVSHELRTPLTVLGGFLETLADMDEAGPGNAQRAIEADEAAGQPHEAAGGGSAHAVATRERAESAARRVRRRAGAVRALHQDAQALSAGRHRIARRAGKRPNG